MPTTKGQRHGDSVYRRHLRNSIAINSAKALMFVGISAYLLFFVAASILSGTFFTPLVLTYICVTAVVMARAFPNFVYACLLPYTEWKMYNRDYLRLHRVYRKVLALKKPLGLNSYAEIVTRCNLANVQLQLGEYEEGESIYRDCLELLQKVHANVHTKNIKQLYGVYVNCGLAVALCHQDKFLESELVLASVFDALNSKSLAASSYEGYAYYLLGHTHLGLKEASAEENILKAVKIIQTAKNSHGFREHSRNQMLNACNLALAEICLDGGRVDEANKFHDKFFAELEEGRSTISPLAVKDMSIIAGHYLQLRDYARAEKTLQLCYSLMAPTPFAPLAKKTMSQYETLLTETGRVGEVTDLRSWLHPVSLLTHI